MAGLCAPLSTLRQYPRGYLRMTRGRCGSLLLHRDGLAPSTPCRSPGALRYSPISGHPQGQAACLKLWLGLLEGSFKLIYKDAVSNKIPPPPGDAEYRKAQGLPPNPDNDVMK